MHVVQQYNIVCASEAAVGLHMQQHFLRSKQAQTTSIHMKILQRCRRSYEFRVRTFHPFTKTEITTDVQCAELLSLQLENRTCRFSHSGFGVWRNLIMNTIHFAWTKLRMHGTKRTTACAVQQNGFVPLIMQQIVASQN